MLNFIQTKFKFKARNTNFKKELIGGLVTFAAMLYILPVNTSILKDIGGSNMPEQGVFIATAVTAAISSIMVGIFSNLPISMAPGMGSNAFFSYTMAHQYGLPWESALSVVILTGITFTALSISGVTTKFIKSIPLQLKYAMTCGLGLFITFIGLTNSGIVNTAHGLEFGGFGDIKVVLGLVGIIGVLALFMFKKISGFSILIVMVFLALLSMIIGQIAPNTGLVKFSDISFDLSKTSQFKDVALKGYTNMPDALSNPKSYMSLLALTFMFLSGSAGTVLAIGNSANLMDKNGHVEGEKQYVISTGVASVIAGSMGSSPAGGFLESNSGVEAGARTGFSSIITGLLFGLSILIFPLFKPFTQGFVTAPSLVFIGLMMFMGIKNIDVNDYQSIASVFMLVIMLIFTNNILTGISFGFITYIALFIISKRWREIDILTYVFGGLFLTYLIVEAIL